MSTPSKLCLIMLFGLAPGPVSVAEEADAAKIPGFKALEAAGAVIGEVILDRSNVFDTSLPGEHKSFYRLANRWHIVTRDSIVRQQLLFKPGDPISARLIEETERLLRLNNYLFDAKITPVRYEDGVVDVLVWTRDLWTLFPDISISRSGGENSSRLGLSEQNFLGYGVKLKAVFTSDVDRDSLSFEYFDRNLGRTWASMQLKTIDSSDGDTQQVRLVRPFYSLDSRWTAGTDLLTDERVESFYDLGEKLAEYTQETDFLVGFGGWSKGLHKGWVRRWTAGAVYDDRQFSAVAGGTLPALIPADRRLVYPFVGFRILEDEFETSSNRDQMERTEDFYMGATIAANLGWASESFGSDRDALIYSIDASNGFGSIAKKALLLNSSLRGRFDNGDAADTRFAVNSRYYNQLSKKTLFFWTLDATWGENLDLDNLIELGGDSGLRGYPLRYQVGESRALFTIEQRYFTDWYPFRLFRVGGAIFGDVGRTWGDNPVGGPPLGWLKDVGIGLRLAPTRSSGRDVIHIDIAFPLDGDPSIDSVQLLIESKKSF